MRALNSCFGIINNAMKFGASKKISQKQCSIDYTCRGKGILRRGSDRNSSGGGSRFISSYHNADDGRSENGRKDGDIKHNPYIRGSETHFGFESVGVHEKEGRVKQVFENVADSYDVMNDFMSGGLHRYWKDQLLDMSTVGSIARIIRQQTQPADTEKHEKNSTLRILDVAGGTGS